MSITVKRTQGAINLKSDVGGLFSNPPDTKDKFCDMIKEMEEEYTKPCDKDIKDCTKHKYHCAKCNTAVSYSPANYASRPQDIPNWCLKCQKDNTSPQIQKEMQ